MLLPLRYSTRNVLVRRASALLTVLGIALTVAVFAGILSLREGFAAIYAPRGEEDIAVYMRPGATSEGESAMRRETVEILMKERPEIVRTPEGRPIAAAESYLAVYLDDLDGNPTNVPLRGIQPMSLEIMRATGQLRLVEGRWPEWGTDEVVVGLPLTKRMQHASLGDTITLNITPFEVVGVFQHDGAQGGEVWGDVERMMEALDRAMFQRVVARVKPGTDFAALQAELEDDARVPSKVLSEREYLAAQTGFLSGTLAFLAGFLTIIMGASAVLGAMNTMLASVSARTHEVGVLLAVGYGRFAVFLTFLVEAAVLGLLGGAVGVLLTLPFHGLETGLTNFNTFTDVSFAFRVTPRLVGSSFVLAFVLGLVGGTLPAIRAARLQPVEALRAL